MLWRAAVAVLIAALIGLVPALPAAGTPPTAEVHRLPVDGWVAEQRPAAGRSPSEATPVWLSPELTADDVVAVGADWGGAADVTVEVRARKDGRWGSWTPLHLVADHAPDPGSDEAAHAATTVSDPVWLGVTEAVQLRRRGGPADLQVDVHAVSLSGGDGLGYRPARALRGAPAYAAPVQPTIISRRAWGADESKRRDAPSYAEDVRFAVVHHTAGANDYSCAESDDIVRAIYAFHVDARGWDDIAYNFLVDKCGQVFEGRFGGVTEPVIGAHAAGWNGGSTGVSALGNYDTAQPPQAMIQALDRLLAWKLDLHHVDPFGTTEELAGGGGSNRFERGDRLTMPAIIGHRVTNQTSCPGDNLVAHIVDEHPEHPWDRPAERWAPVAAHRVEPIGVPKTYGGPPAELEKPVTGHRPRWDVDFTEPSDWRLTIHDQDGQLIRSTGGEDVSGVRLAWDLRDAAGDPVAPGTYTAELTSWAGLSEASPVRTTIEVTGAADRVWGDDRIETALELSRWSFESARRVVIATSQSYVDALAATPLAGSFGGPVLLTDPHGLTPEVAVEIRRLQAEEAWIIGGEQAISRQVAADLSTDAGIDPDEVHRLAGGDRYETAHAVADLVVDREGASEVLIAVGRHVDDRRAFPDALSAGALGAEFDLPIVLAEPVRLPSATHRFLTEHRFADGVQLFGGPVAISEDVERAVRDAAGVEVRRFAGSDRYDTSRLAAEDVLRRWAEYEAEIGGPSPYLDGVGLEVAVASGENWPDALGAGAAADERRRTVFLLTPPDEVDATGATARFLEEHSADVTHVVLAGGTVAVAARVLAQLEELVRLDGPHTDTAERWPEDPHAPPDLPAPGPTSSPSPTG